jgi:lipid-A-disaccharide synthase
MTDAGNSPRKLGVIAGGGPLPLRVAEAARVAGREVYIVGIEGVASSDIAQFPHGWSGIGMLGGTLALLKGNQCQDVVVVGAVKRPNLLRIRLDSLGVKFLFRVWRAMRRGDDALLRVLVGLLESHGFRVLGADQILHSLLAPEGVWTKKVPRKSQQSDIDLAIAAAREIGARDIGQGAVASEGKVVAREDVRGTDMMLAALREDANGGVLVKLPKLQQERRIDLPTIGVTTVERAARAGLSGIAVEAGGVLASELEMTIARANELGIFIFGFPASRGASSPQGKPRIMLVAGEVSGDALGAELMQAISDERKGQVTFSGVGGSAMRAKGLRPLFPMTDIAVMGPREVLPRLRLILRRIRETVEHAVSSKPDVLVIIDSPDFTHTVAKRVHRRKPEIPIVNYVSPSVWAWRQGRALSMARYLKRVLALLPFEPEFFRAHGALDCVYVGHPAIERIPELGSGTGFRARHGIAAAAPLLLVLPGSRFNEVKRLQNIFGEAARLLKNELPGLRVVVPAVPHVRGLVEQSAAQWGVDAIVIEGEEEKRSAFDAANAAVAASGTVSLELGLAGVPMVIGYKIDPIAAALLKYMIKVPSIVLVNLILDRPSVNEFLQSSCTPSNLATALLPLLSDSPTRRRALADLADLRRVMEVGGESPSRRAARAVLDMLPQFAQDSREN